MAAEGSSACPPRSERQCLSWAHLQEEIVGWYQYITSAIWRQGRARKGRGRHNLHSTVSLYQHATRDERPGHRACTVRLAFPLRGAVVRPGLRAPGNHTQGCVAFARTRIRHGEAIDEARRALVTPWRRRRQAGTRHGPVAGRLLCHCAAVPRIRGCYRLGFFLFWHETWPGRTCSDNMSATLRHSGVR